MEMAGSVPSVRRSTLEMAAAVSGGASVLLGLLCSFTFASALAHSARQAGLSPRKLPWSSLVCCSPPPPTNTCRHFCWNAGMCWRASSLAPVVALCANCGIK